MRDDASRGLLLVAGATFFWSLSGVFARWLPQVDPWTFNATRGLGMGVALLLWMAWEYRLGAIRLFLQSDPARWPSRAVSSRSARRCTSWRCSSRASRPRPASARPRASSPR
ncbi:MAG: DMT family transporter [Rhodoferax sp.]|nr:DMT family transporter [Rhodoferax sp.]